MYGLPAHTASLPRLNFSILSNLNQTSVKLHDFAKFSGVILYMNPGFHLIQYLKMSMPANQDIFALEDSMRVSTAHTRDGFYLT